MKVYTKTGDTGTTSLFGGQRVPKHHIRIESYGTLDELNAFIGLLRDQDIQPVHRETLGKIQHLLFTIGAMLATPPEKELLKNGQKRLNIATVAETDIALLENEIDRMEDTLPTMTHFILPGGHTTVSYCHIARCVCRRAERLVVHLDELEPVEPAILQYLNRLSDYLFVLGRKIAAELGADEVKWIPEKN